MKHAFTLYGLMSLVVLVGAYYAFTHDAEAPQTIIHDNDNNMALTLTSPAFKDGEAIPSKHTCDGENISPELHIDGIPKGTESLVLVMDDPDIPDSVKENIEQEAFDHWAVFNIPKETRVIKEGERIGQGGFNSKRMAIYAGPCPPDGEHRYIFRLYAVSGIISYEQTPTLRQVESSAKRMAIESARLIGVYKR